MILLVLLCLLSFLFLLRSCLIYGHAQLGALDVSAGAGGLLLLVISFYDRRTVASCPIDCT
ncbi:hypothetical protein V1511DRAFT_500000 [Dipodascopsis uninucleata]